ncbi:MFS transporter [Corynebacterium imitans]|uniref:MFS transporter n=1 Tax=Corynebacterium imitans TaxID=156978 RepID=UPI001EF32C05|nr:MFS transporter [Corynebacterium imitans]MCG7279415.1 MFS transporter [Corynebacterium imitans]
MKKTTVSYHPREQVTRTALAVWWGAVAVYIVAIFGRTSFGVASMDAMARFEVSASQIAVFTAVQVGVYAAAQVPTGLAIDRFGPRFMLVSGAVVMAAGQIALGLTTSYGLALAARALIGLGDATAFLSVMRILPYWFPPRKTPLYTQLTGALGQLGQFLSAVPFLALLGARGWTVAFVSLGALGLIFALVAALVVSDSPEWSAMTREQRREVHAQKRAQRVPLAFTLRTVVRSPIAWEAFFIHGWVIFWMFSFSLLWGVPLMTQGMELSEAQAGTALILFSVGNVIAAPIMGVVSARLGVRRDLASLWIGAIVPIAFAVLFASPEPRGFGAALVVTSLLGLCMPAGNFGFDTLREYLPAEMVATGTGLANMGGFLACMIGSQLVGVLLDWSAGGAEFTWADFRIAWLAFFGTAAVCLIGLLVSRRKAKRITRHVPIVSRT